MKLIRMTLAATALAGFAGTALAQQPAHTTAAQPQATAPAAQPAPATSPADDATTTTQDSSAATPAAPVRAAASDLTVGAQVTGPDGQPVGTIETADATGATVTTGTARGRLALDAFYKNESGLTIGYTRAQLNQMGTPVTGSSPAPANAAAPQN